VARAPRSSPRPAAAPRHIDYLLLGGGPASATAADTLRAEGAEGSIAIVAAETELPYNRPPLSKQFLLGRQMRGQLAIFPSEHYARHGIELLSGVRATAVEPARHLVHTDLAGSLSYGKLLIATGAAPRRLEVPGADLPGVHLLRTLHDAEALRATAKRSQRAVIVGGSYIGMELAATLNQLGIAVTLLTRDHLLLDRLRSPALSAFFLDYLQARGVEVRLDETVSEFVGDQRLEGVRPHSGQLLACDMAAIGIGAVPATDFLAGSGIEIDHGIVADACLRTSQPDVFAAGDVASYFDRGFDQRWRFDHWDNAVKQGRQAARNMLGQPEPYDGCSYFFTDVFDLTLHFLGSTLDTDEQIGRGNLAAGSYALLYLRRGVLRGILSIGRPAEETKAAEALVRHQVDLTPYRAQLADPAFNLASIPAQTVLVLQGGGALGAFECGVVRALEEHAIHPDVVAGVSIGAINAALIAGNPRRAAPVLEAFWNELALDTPAMPTDALRRQLASAWAVMFGCPPFFRPRWLWPWAALDDPQAALTSYYDPTPLKQLLAKYIDFPALKDSPVRLLLSAVDVETAELVTFDSHRDEITADHILASGSLPPGFPWTTIEGRHYWDGGIVSNSPLDLVVERCGATGKRVFIVDLYPNRQSLPRNMAEVMTRRDEIVYSEKIRHNAQQHELIRNFRRLTEEILNNVDPLTAGHIRQRPHYIQLMGDLAPLTVTRIVLRDEAEQGKDHDFSRQSIAQRQNAGYAAANRALRNGGRRT
jgi:NTE family protein